MEIDEIFDYLSTIIEHYEPRYAQKELSKYIYKTLIENKIGIFEAPTGIGKSFAYLVACSLFSSKYTQKCIIATNTINLQKQLILKDIPQIAKIFPHINYKIALGRQNYVCKRKFYTYVNSLFTQIENPIEFLSSLKHGTKDEFEQLGQKAFEQIKSDKDSCMGRFCPHFRSCFLYTARAKLQESHIIVTNHHLVFNDLFEKADIFDRIDAIVFDEAHNVEKNLTTYATLSFDVENQSILIKNFFHALNAFGLFELFNKINPLLDKMKATVNNISSFLDFAESYAHLKSKIENFLKNLVYLQESIVYEFSLFRKQVDLEIEPDFVAIIEKLSSNLKILKAFELSNDSLGILWLEKTKKNVVFNITALDLANLFKTKLYTKVKTIIFTSATLSVQHKFDFLKNALGIDNAVEKKFETEFDYKKQTKLIVLKDIHQPDKQEFLNEISCVVKISAKKINKGILVLFTSYKMLSAVFDLCVNDLQTFGYEVLKQGFLDNYNMQKSFLEKKTIIFGVNSFWEGIDIKGEGLSCVIITKLPFEVPTHPIEQAKYVQIEQNGQNAFLNYSLQKAALKFKQGFGRLIRTKFDKGFVIVTDPRFLTKSYGRVFLESLPKLDIKITNLQYLDQDLDGLTL